MASKVSHIRAHARVLYRHGSETTVSGNTLPFADPQDRRAGPKAAPTAPDDLRADHLRNIQRLKKLRADAVERVLQKPKPGVAGQMHQGRPLVPTRAPLTDVIAKHPPQFWLRHTALPFDRLGRTALVLVADLDVLPTLQEALKDDFDVLLPVVANAQVIEKHLLAQFDPALTKAASGSVPAAESCRSFDPTAARPLAFACIGALLSLCFIAPQFLATAASALALFGLLMFTALRVTGLFGQMRPHRPPPETLPPEVLPRISMLVPLFREAEIGRHLLRRLCRLSYPRDRLEVLLVVEEDDQITQEAIRLADLPDWFRVVEVPGYGALKTKPRAMNYALNFCRGDIIGVWDAEDAPEPHQLHRVARHFATAPPEVVCLQGVLDFYNCDHNWVSRCFTLEYAGWFRVLLQGLARLRLVVPLGGTTMFIRRSALEQLGAWDAHNVTEDADLGVRIARRGLRTEMVAVTTYEEANSRVIPWIKQRSRWLKGFMMTYLVHMRAPRALWRDLGPRRFFGFQAFFLGTIGQSLMGPVLWSFWLVALGLGHPASAYVPDALLHFGVSALILFEALSIAIWIAGARASGRGYLAWNAPLMPIYFLMSCAAAVKALYEVFAAPFFWDKTQHGDHGGAD